MPYVPAVEPKAVAKKSGGARPPSSPLDGQPTAERIELQVPLGWTAALDATAKALGVTRSALIRLALIRLHQAEGRPPLPLG